jgi:hypothetical protein
MHIIHSFIQVNDHLTNTFSDWTDNTSKGDQLP